MYVPNHLSAACSIRAPRQDYGQKADFWDLPVRCSHGLPSFMSRSTLCNTYKKGASLSAEDSCPDRYQIYLLTLNLSVSFFKSSAISRKSATCCVNSSIVARTSSEFAETSSVPAAFS